MFTLRASLLLYLSLYFSLAQAQVSLNPDLSLNSLFLVKQGNHGNQSTDPSPNGFHLQEAELRLTSNIDAYFRGDAVFSIEEEDGEYGIGPEEAFVETLRLPSLTLRAGKFYPYWNRSSQWHTHAFPFIDRMQSSAAIFGDEGLNETGLAASMLLPIPWYAEVVAQIFNGDNAQVFGSPSQDDVAGVLFFKNLWDLNSESTLELDLGYGAGRNGESIPNHIYTAALTFKGKVAQKHGYLASAEYVRAEKLLREDPNSSGTYLNEGESSALSTWVQYQVFPRWWLQARHELAKTAKQNVLSNSQRDSLLIAFLPSEYSSLRLQWDGIDSGSSRAYENRFTLQIGISMGSHPAHNY